MEYSSAETSPDNPPRSRISVEDEALLMNRGRSRQLIGLAVGAIAVVAVLVLFLWGVTRGDSYSATAVEASRIEHAHILGFLGCALPGSRPSELNAEQLHTAFEAASTRFGSKYSTKIDGCMPKVQLLAESVKVMPVPSGLEAEHAALLLAANRLTAAATEYQSHLAVETHNAQDVAAMLLLEKLGAGFAGYRSAQSELVQRLELQR